MLAILIKEAVWSQFSASIDMLKNAISAAMDEYGKLDSDVYYNAYHCLIFLEYYLTIPAPEMFEATLPFIDIDPLNKPEGVIGDVMPSREYTQKELLDYLSSLRIKCYKVISERSAESLTDRWVEEHGDMDYSVLEILLYNLRHVQHHTAQLNLLLRQKLDKGSEWIGRAE